MSSASSQLPVQPVSSLQSPRSIQHHPHHQHHLNNMALPLLEGLVAAPGESVSILKQALTKELAWHTVRRALKQWVWKHQILIKPNPSRPQKRVKRFDSVIEPFGGLRKKSSLSLSGFDTLDHWWWFSLVSYADMERCAAARILIKACNGSPPLSEWMVRPILIILERLVQGITASQTDVTPSTPGPRPPLSRRFISEWVGLLDHVWSPPSSKNGSNNHMVLMAQVRWNLIERVANYVMQLATILYQENEQEHESAKPRALLSTLAANDLFRGLLRLLHKWLLECGDDKESIYRNLHIWKTQIDKDGGQLSSLAALLAAHAATKAGLQWHVPSSTNNNESSPAHLNICPLLYLGRFVDPECCRKPRAKPLVKQPATVQRRPNTASASTGTSTSTRSMSLSSVLERSNLLESTSPAVASTSATQSAIPPPPRLNEHDEIFDEEDVEGDDEDIIVEEADDHEDDGDNEDAVLLDAVIKDDDGDRMVVDPEDEDDYPDEEEHLVNGSSDDDDDEDDEDDDEDEDDIEHDIEFEHITASEAENRNRSSSTVVGGLFAGNPSASRYRDASNEATANQDSDPSAATPIYPPVAQRQEELVRATMQVMARQYPRNKTVAAHENVSLSTDAEDELLGGINRIIQPPKKPVTTKIIMRRAPTQEEFFRGNLSRNPISIDSLKAAAGGEPTVADLRQFIANDLHMPESVELLEIIIANKIVDVNLKLRVVHEVLWRRHLMENTTTSGSSGGGGHSFLSMGSGFSMIFSHGGRSSGGGTITYETPPSQLPPLVCLYRLAGVDGEATEDTVTELIDPEAAVVAATPEERERLLEKEYGMTRIVLERRGAHILLRAIQRNISRVLRSIRRDDVRGETFETTLNPSRSDFRKKNPSHALTLLRHCARLAVNRKLLLNARAPTVLLTLLLEVLKGLEEPGSSAAESKSNPTADMLQELIETLTSDITEVGTGFQATDGIQDSSSMPLLLESIETTSLGPHLRNVIAKLLPFLTYGQVDLSQSLAHRFKRHIMLSSLTEKQDNEAGNILMSTFVSTAISLPGNDVCNALRAELVGCGFIDSVCAFIMKDIPEQPPSWSAALWPKGHTPERTYNKWRAYLIRPGVRTAFKILTGLCKQHPLSQNAVCKYPKFVQSLHWLEATSDSADYQIEMDGLGLLAETLLDELGDCSLDVKKVIDAVRKKTRTRKKELAQERRTRTLGKLSSFSSIAGVDSSSDRKLSGVFSILQPGIGLFSSAPSAASSSTEKEKEGTKSEFKPSWLAEMEAIEEEPGMQCCVCQEGRTSQPSELLGLYVFVRKVAIPLEQGGSRASIDGSMLLKSLPKSPPATLLGQRAGEEWFQVGRAAGEDLTPTTSICMSSGSNRKSSIFTTTVSAGNGIHMSCHVRARQADRSHPKAPKSEWEGAKLRNGRVDCNVILPLVSSRSSKVSLVAVDSALSEHQTAVANLIGTTPPSPLFTILFDMRFLLLRMAYGEPLNIDCGGGSLSSNCELLLYEMLSADMFEKNAQIDQPEQSQHALGLSSGFLAAVSILSCGDFSGCDKTSLIRGIADAAPMACITCILFHNCYDDSGSGSAATDSKAHPNWRWVVGRDLFLKGLLLCAGRRRALGIDSSGCLPNRGPKKRLRPSSFADWDNSEAESKENSCSSFGSQGTLVDYQHSLRPMLTFFVLMDQLSSVFSTSLEDDMIGSCAETLVRTLEDCLGCKNIDELLVQTKTAIAPQEIVGLVQDGMGITAQKP